MDLATLDFGILNESQASESELLSNEQEWLKKRWGKFSASEIYRLMAYPDKGLLSDGAKNYAKEKAVESLTVFEPGSSWVNAAMQWGKDHELEAIAVFAEKTGIDALHTGNEQKWLESDCGQWGGTPDGLTEFEGVEVKCPNSVTHFDYLTIKNAADLKQLAANYYWQVTACATLRNALEWFFITYDPRFIRPDLRLHWVLIEIDLYDQALMLERIEQAIDYKNELLQRLV